MADELRKRRERRRSRILENAEDRKRKIFGTARVEGSETGEVKGPSQNYITNSNLSYLNANEDNVETSGIQTASKAADFGDTGRMSESNEASRTTDFRDIRTSVLNDVSRPTDVPVVNGTPTKRDSIRTSGTSGNNETSREQTDLTGPRITTRNNVQNGAAVPNMAEQLLNINRLITANGGLNPGTMGNTTPQQEEALGVTAVPVHYSWAVPVFLAVVVCALITFNMGYVVSNSISLPFMLWEAHHLWCQRSAVVTGGGTRLLGMALVLCGVQQTTVASYTQIIALLRCFLEDFAMYIATVVFWCAVIGLPGGSVGIVQPQDPLASAVPTTPTLTKDNVVIVDDDPFDPLEDF